MARCVDDVNSTILGGRGRKGRGEARGEGEGEEEEQHLKQRELTDPELAHMASIRMPDDGAMAARSAQRERVPGRDADSADVAAGETPGDDGVAGRRGEAGEAGGAPGKRERPAVEAGLEQAIPRRPGAGSEADVTGKEATRASSASAGETGEWRALERHDSTRGRGGGGGDDGAGRTREQATDGGGRGQRGEEGAGGDRGARQMMLKRAFLARDGEIAAESSGAGEGAGEGARGGEGAGEEKETGNRAGEGEDAGDTQKGGGGGGGGGGKPSESSIEQVASSDGIAAGIRKPAGKFRNGATSRARAARPPRKAGDKQERSAAGRSVAAGSGEQVATGRVNAVGRSVVYCLLVKFLVSDGNMCSTLFIGIRALWLRRAAFIKYSLLVKYSLLGIRALWLSARI